MQSRNPFVRMQVRFEQAFERLRDRYHGLLERCLHHRRAFLVAFFSACVGSLALIIPWLGQDFFPSYRQRLVQSPRASSDGLTNRRNRPAL